MDAMAGGGGEGQKTELMEVDDVLKYDEMIFFLFR